MTHEFECPWPEDEGPNDCLWCLAISAAYRRGRENAAADISLVRTNGGFMGREEIFRDSAVAAALGTLVHTLDEYGYCESCAAICEYSVRS